MTSQPWTHAPLSALDLEGTGAQERDREAILEIAVVPLVGGSPDMGATYETLVNPGRPVPSRPWISPGLTDDVLREAPRPEEVGPGLHERVAGRYLVGHNVSVDWRLLHRHYPGLRPAGLIDTLRLARAARLEGSKTLGAVLDRFGLRSRVDALVPGGRPHRALWDTVAAGLLLPVLVREVAPPVVSLESLLRVASPSESREMGEFTLF
ncbi:3'-5' exonuclease [Nocardiopsis synnemataformans]|uniref:3'-5' exonuclease n=1 Tax=Nocardiopsis synnemataformans TaxID=61305 RepID=UPI003EB88E67